jgi:hypothetical protein
VFAQPRELALRELPRAAFHQLNRFSQGTLAAQVLHDLPVTDGLQSGLIFGEPVIQQVPRFRNKSAPEHFIHADIDARVQVGRSTGEAKEEFWSPSSEFRIPLGPLLGKRAAR